MLEWATVTAQLAAAGDQTPSFVESTHPLPDGMAITLTDKAHFEPLLRRILPVVTDDVVRGVPGLRTFPRRNCLELRLLGAGNDVRARMRLLGFGRHRVRDMLDDLVENSDNVQLHSTNSLSSNEIPLVRRQHLPAAAILSGLLRRVLLWRAADRLGINVADEIVRLDWDGGPNAHDVADVLRSSSCAIPQATVSAALKDGGRGVIITAVESTRSISVEPWDAWTALANASHRAGQLVPAPHLNNATQVVMPWELPEMRAALAAREVSTIYKLLRRNGVSSAQIAAMTGQSRSEVSEILKGRQVMAYDVLVRIADGLGVPRGYMGLAYDEVIAARVTETRQGAKAYPSESMKRTGFLGHALAVAIGSYGVDTRRTHGVLHSGTPEPRVVLAMSPSAELFEARRVQTTVTALRLLHRDYGVDACHTAVLEELARAQGLLLVVNSKRAKAQLKRAITELNNLASSEDSDKSDLAQNIKEKYWAKTEEYRLRLQWRAIALDNWAPQSVVNESAILDQ